MAEICAPLWEILLPRIRGFDQPPVDTSDTGEPDPPLGTDTGTPTDLGKDDSDGVSDSDDGRGCGCHAGRAPAAIGTHFGYGGGVGATIGLVGLWIRRGRNGRRSGGATR